MNASKLIIITLLLIYPYCSKAQQFWHLTREFQGGPKTGIALIDDSLLFAGTTTGVLKSTNDGLQFQQVLTASRVHSLYASSSGILYAGGTGKIFYSEDLGATWDSVSLNTTHKVRQFAGLNDGSLFAITGDMNQGDGVFYSGNGKTNWEARNHGLGDLQACERIATDKNGRLYLAITDENASGNGGLYISDTKGLLWQKIPVRFNQISSPVKITNITGLSVSPDDSLYLSFYGINANFLVQLNLCKSIHDITSESSWRVLQVHPSSSWWLDRPLNNLHFSQKGDWYGSFTETVNKGGTYFSETNGCTWIRIDYGLGLNNYGMRELQYFAEKKSGRIFMVQYLDERIYTTTKSLTTNIKSPQSGKGTLQVYPNPVKSGGKLTIQVSEADESAEISIYDVAGRKSNTSSHSDRINEIQAPEKPGIYIIALKHGNKINTEKILVY